jgi:hypothetical protein
MFVFVKSCSYAKKSNEKGGEDRCLLRTLDQSPTERMLLLRRHGNADTAKLAIVGLYIYNVERTSPCGTTLHGVVRIKGPPEASTRWWLIDEEGKKLRKENLRVSASAGRSKLRLGGSRDTISFHIHALFNNFINVTSVSCGTRYCD